MRQKWLLVSFVIVMYHIPALADEPKHINCSELNLPDKTFVYGKGEILDFRKMIPPSHTPVRRKKPDAFGGKVLFSNQTEIVFLSEGRWKNPDAPLAELEAESPAIPIIPGHLYGFCYTPVTSGTFEYLWIKPETIRLIDEK